MEPILSLIERYYEMKAGEFIQNHQSFFVVHDDEIELRITYRAVKHIVEKRKKDGFNPIEIKELFDLALNILINLNYRHYTQKPRLFYPSFSLFFFLCGAIVEASRMESRTFLFIERVRPLCIRNISLMCEK